MAALTLKDLIQLEDLFDRGKIGKDCVSDNQTGLFLPLLRSVLGSDWSVTHLEAKRLFSLMDSACEKAFVLQWGVIAAEIQYDLKCRDQWLARWSEVPSWATEAYCRYLRMYQEGLSAFFETSLVEAESRFKKAYEIAGCFSYGRGQMRCLFHLGLVQRDRGHPSDACRFFEAALDFATKRGADSYVSRIETQLARLGRKSERGLVRWSESETNQIARLKSQIEALILDRQFEASRRVLVEAEILRRRIRLGRNRESLFIYLPFLHWSRGNTSVGARYLGRIADSILRIRVLELKKKIFGLEPAKERELSTLQEVHSVASVVIRSSEALGGGSDLTEICGVPLSDIADQDICGLMRLLVTSLPGRSVTKERICSEIWSLKYDPVTHDPKVYKLIHKTRLFFGKPKLFLNTYGGYQINPKFLGKNDSSVLRLSGSRPN